ncbi:glutathione S-transferase [Trichoderma evansii]
MGIPTDITLYTATTPNGVKISTLLEELGLEYKVIAIDMSITEQKAPWFFEINPNGRIPAITDKWTDESDIRVSESGAILQYLVDRYDKDHKGFLFWQMGGVGPMQGQANHFVKFAPEKIQYGIDRYINETRRLYSVLDAQLAKSTSGFIVGDRVTIADFALFGWIAGHDYTGVSLDEFSHIDKWLKTLSERLAFQKGWQVP